MEKDNTNTKEITINQSLSLLMGASDRLRLKIEQYSLNPDPEKLESLANALSTLADIHLKYKQFHNVD